MRRREFIALLGGAATTWPLAAQAQQAIPVVGFLGGGTPRGLEYLVEAFRRGLSEAGFVEGRNVTIEYSWAEDQQDRLPALAADLVRRQVAVIVAGPTAAALAVKAATTTIPVVFQTGRDPVKDGLVTSFNRPGGNVTGVSQLAIELGAKRLALLRELVPHAGLIAVLTYPQSVVSQEQVKDLLEAAGALGLRILVLNVESERDLNPAFASLVEQRADALVVSASAFFVSRRDRLVALAASNAVPTVYQSREYMAAGGLMSYGSDFSDVYRQVGVYTGRILRGEKPADLPVVQPTKFELVINLKTAKALGLTVPLPLQAAADEVIE
jgi:putative tryptophan/tyrosine transport system substrate-binding protein